MKSSFEAYLSEVICGRFFIESTVTDIKILCPIGVMKRVQYDLDNNINRTLYLDILQLKTFDDIFVT